MPRPYNLRDPPVGPQWLAKPATRLSRPLLTMPLHLGAACLLAVACAGSVPPEPVDGELYLEQIHVRGPSIGEATLVRAPDGSSALIDVGNDAHTDAVLEAIDRVLGVRRVDVVLLTHHHADHVGGLDDLAKRVELGAVVARTRDLAAANEGEWREIESLVTLDPCDDDGCALEWPLGAVTLRVLAGNATLDGEALADGDENARSLMGTVEYGAFTYLFAGDLTGGGKDTPDVEAAFAERFATGSVEVVHLSHHGIDSSTSPGWVDAFLPDDGRTRQAFVGSNRGYLSSPSPDVVARVAPRLGGGRIWAPAVGSVADGDGVCVAHAPVALHASEERYEVFAAGDCAAAAAETWP